MGVTNANLRAAMTVSETLEKIASASTAAITHDKFNTNVKLTPSSTPPAAEVVSFEPTISGGGFQIDLTALPGSDGTIDATGLKLQAILVSNPAASAGYVNIAGGIVDDYNLPGGFALHVLPGGFAMAYFPEGLADVGPSAKLMEVVATNGDKPQIMLLLG